MDSPQYRMSQETACRVHNECFKPYYKWIVLNTIMRRQRSKYLKVLNLIING